MKAISIITVIKNRIRNFRVMQDFLNRAIHDVYIEHVVVDFVSDDADVKEECKNFKNTSKVITLKSPFRRSAGLNRGFAKSSGDLVFFLDTDIVVPQDIFQIIRKVTKPGQAYFPSGRMIKTFDFSRSLEEQVTDKSNFRMFWPGHGICSFVRDDFIKVGKWDETFTTYGNEDHELFRRTTSKGIRVLRRKEPFMYHLPHPTSRAWKNRYF